jgi:hypothetical protein
MPIPHRQVTKGQDMKDTLKFTAMLMVAALVWLIVNPVEIVVGLIVTAFPAVMIVGLTVAAVSGLHAIASEDES